MTPTTLHRLTKWQASPWEPSGPTRESSAWNPDSDQHRHNRTTASPVFQRATTHAFDNHIKPSNKMPRLCACTRPLWLQVSVMCVCPLFPPADHVSVRTGRLGNFLFIEQRPPRPPTGELHRRVLRVRVPLLHQHHRFALLGQEGPHQICRDGTEEELRFWEEEWSLIFHLCALGCFTYRGGTADRKQVR